MSDVRKIIFKIIFIVLVVIPLALMGTCFFMWGQIILDRQVGLIPGALCFLLVWLSIKYLINKGKK